jgi:hypothetical protein
MGDTCEFPEQPIAAHVPSGHSGELSESFDERKVAAKE